MRRIDHIITGLGAGGAEMLLHGYLSRMDRARWDARVISLTSGGLVAERIRALGVPVEILGMSKGAPRWGALTRLAGLLRRRRPDVVQTWMYHANLLGGMVARLSAMPFRAAPPIVWGIFQSNLDPALNKRSTLWMSRFSSAVSGSLPSRIVFNSESARRAHETAGYDPSRMTVITNGFDVDTFRPLEGARERLRAAQGWAPDTFVVGLLARFDPQKDHATFLRAAGLLHARRPEVRFAVAGPGVTPENRALFQLAARAGLHDAVRFLGEQSHAQEFLSALDVFALSSAGESLPNVLGEAMACGVPCVTTDVGDTALIVGDAGRVVPPVRPDALAAAIEAVLSLSPQERRAVGEASRRRVVEHFSLATSVARYDALYSSLLPGYNPPSNSSEGTEHEKS